MTAYHAYDLDIMAKVADGARQARRRGEVPELYEKRKAFFNATFVNADKKTLATGDAAASARAERPTGRREFRVADTQTSYAVGLGMGLFDDATTSPSMVDEPRRDGDAREHGRRRGGAPDVFADDRVHRHGVDQQGAVADTATSELAYRLLHNNQYPSWLYAIDQGATTIWERLNGYTVENGFGGNNSMNSFNHYSFGAVGQWMMAYSLGIERDEPGFRDVHPAAGARSDRRHDVGRGPLRLDVRPDQQRLEGRRHHADLSRHRAGEHDGHALPPDLGSRQREGRRTGRSTRCPA